MIKRFYLLAVIICLSFFSYGQFDTSFAKVSIRRCADSLVYGFKSKDWELFARYTQPALIGTMGGKKEFITYISEAFKQIPDSAWKLYEPGKVLQVVKAANDLQSVIELKSIIEWQGTRIASTTYLVGASWDGGLFWTFFDTQGELKNAKAIKPDLSNQLIIPKKQEKAEHIVTTYRKTN
jgi:hypothetical protein